jgi:hypothetical protein
MKTAISIPDDTFDRVTRTARELGMSRSELLTKAAVIYLDHLESNGLTEEINRALRTAPLEEWTDQTLVATNKAALRAIDDDW